MVKAAKRMGREVKSWPEWERELELEDNLCSITHYHGGKFQILFDCCTMVSGQTKGKGRRYSTWYEDMGRIS